MHDVPGSHWHQPAAGKRTGFGKFGRPKTPYLGLVSWAG
jgi:hypothetical protein